MTEVAREERRNRLLELLGSGDNVAFVADEGGDVVGELVLALEDEPVASVGMSVADPWRRRGVGTALLEEAITWGRGNGLRRLTLEAWWDNEPALALYRKLGFAEDRRRSGDHGEVVLMSRAL